MKNTPFKNGSMVIDWPFDERGFKKLFSLDDSAAGVLIDKTIERMIDEDESMLRELQEHASNQLLFEPATNVFGLCHGTAIRVGCEITDTHENTFWVYRHHNESWVIRNTKKIKVQA